ncbi:MAG: YkgJ family cysteine cluster protein [Desulfobaccales bacterium]
MDREPEQRPVFQCQQCGDCCRGEKGILVTPEEVEAMAVYLGLPVADFTARYLVDTPLGPQLASADGVCIMQAESLCRVHPVKPRICREWPFLKALLENADEFEAAKGACPGLAADAVHEEFVRAAKISEA